MSSRYVGSGYNENITNDAVKMKNLAKSNERLNIPKKEIDFEDFSEIDIRTGRSTLRNAIKLMLWNKKPEWINGEKINREEAESIKKKKEDDHFYPHHFYKQGFIGEEINNILNLCFLPKEENARKRKDLSSKWLENRKKELSPKLEDEKQFFNSNLLPFKSVKDLDGQELILVTKSGSIKSSNLRKYYKKFRKKRFNLFKRELERLQNGR